MRSRGKKSKQIREDWVATHVDKEQEIAKKNEASDERMDTIIHY